MFSICTFPDPRTIWIHCELFWQLTSLVFGHVVVMTAHNDEKDTNLTLGVCLHLGRVYLKYFLKYMNKAYLFL